MSTPLRVTHVVFDLEGGGLESMVAAMVRAGGAHDLTTSVITLSGRAGRTGETVRALTDQFLTTHPTSAFTMIAPTELTHLVAYTRPDVVHLHSGAWYKPALAARLARTPVVVYTEHGREHDDPWVQRMIDRLALRLTDAVVAVSDRLRDYMSRAVRVSAQRVRVITNGVDTEYFAPAAGSPRASNAEPIIGAVGRLETVKGHDVLIDAFARVYGEAPPPRPRLVLCGDGSRREALEAQARGLGVTEAVTFAGWSPSPRDFYQQFDIYALPSRSEGTSVSLLEAMACGALPVVTDVGSNRAVLGPDLDAQVVPSEDPAALAACLSTSLRDVAARRTRSAIARQRVESEFSITQMMRQYRALYDDIRSRRVK